MDPFHIHLLFRSPPPLFPHFTPLEKVASPLLEPSYIFPNLHLGRSRCHPQKCWVFGWGEGNIMSFSLSLSLYGEIMPAWIAPHYYHGGIMTHFFYFIVGHFCLNAVYSILPVLLYCTVESLPYEYINTSIVRVVYKTFVFSFFLKKNQDIACAQTSNTSVAFCSLHTIFMWLK